MERENFIDEIAKEISKRYPVTFIYLYNTKVNVTGEKIKQFDIAVIIENGNSKETEKDIYLNILSEIPFVCLCYTKEEWENLLKDEYSFASRITKKGQLIYGQI